MDEDELTATLAVFSQTNRKFDKLLEKLKQRDSQKAHTNYTPWVKKKKKTSKETTQVNHTTLPAWNPPLPTPPPSHTQTR